MRALFVSAAHKSSGKTVVTIGLAGAFKRRGHHVKPFKKGPDYIDPNWLALASASACRNLDFNTMHHAEIEQTYRAHCATADVALIEGTMGLHDGVATNGEDSNAAMATLLNVPILLVLDARGLARGGAAVLKGLTDFQPGLRFDGVVLNRVSGERHAQKLRTAIENYTDLRVLGALREDPELTIVERHIGLIPGSEDAEAAARVERLTICVEAQIDVSSLCPSPAPKKFPADECSQAVNGANVLEGSPRATSTVDTIACATQSADASLGTGNRDGGFIAKAAAKIKIAIPYDRAFCFYYSDDLQQLREQGAEPIFFDTLHDHRLPQADALFIGGGFPETAMHALSDNLSLRQDIAAAAASGLPIYAECGGLMYLARSLSWNDSQVPMCGVLPFDVCMHARPRGRGYVRLRETGAAPWGRIVGLGAVIPAHEFHYSSVENCDTDLAFAYTVERGSGIDGTHDGVIVNNVLASYAHLRHSQASPWVRAMVEWATRARSLKPA